jgi:lipopolysaccharide biosynthesis protein
MDSFDVENYLKLYPEVSALGMSPKEHFEKYGARLGYCSSFDSSTNKQKSERIWSEERSPNISSAKAEEADCDSVDVNSAAGAISVHQRAWATAFSMAEGPMSRDFVPLAQTHFIPSQNAPKVLAFYLPQFHPIEENDNWWGKGFTEWTNVSKAQPQFIGHNQPRLPGELGFYDLRLPDVLRRQIELAKQYGVAGFCFHYYWFGGKRLLEMPIERFLADQAPESNIEFCLCWANENWTRRWDGADSEVLIEQRHSIEDFKEIFSDLLRYFRDKRYILVNGKPLIVVYRPAYIEGLASMVSIWRSAAKAAGFDGIYLVTSNAFGCYDASSIGFDALVEFPPHGVSSMTLNSQLELLNPSYEGCVYDYNQVVDFAVKRLEILDSNSNHGGYFPCVMMAWDNEARMPGRGHVYQNVTPHRFEEWFASACNAAVRLNPIGEQFVFVNAWNEWAEGTYLEPDLVNGYAYLDAVGAVLSNNLRARMNEAHKASS